MSAISEQKGVDWSLCTSSVGNYSSLTGRDILAWLLSLSNWQRGKTKICNQMVTYCKSSSQSVSCTFPMHQLALSLCHCGQTGIAAVRRNCRRNMHLRSIPGRGTVRAIHAKRMSAGDDMNRDLSSDREMEAAM